MAHGESVLKKKIMSSCLYTWKQSGSEHLDQPSVTFCNNFKVLFCCNLKVCSIVSYSLSLDIIFNQDHLIMVLWMALKNVGHLGRLEVIKYQQNVLSLSHFGFQLTSLEKVASQPMSGQWNLGDDRFLPVLPQSLSSSSLSSSSSSSSFFLLVGLLLVFFLSITFGKIFLISSLDRSSFSSSHSWSKSPGKSGQLSTSSLFTSEAAPGGPENQDTSFH